MNACQAQHSLAFRTLGIAQIAEGAVGWPPEIWGGAIVWSSLTLLALSLLMYPPASPVAHGVH